MCGILGANNLGQFEILYDYNKKRGSFSHGFLFIKRNGSMYIRKGEGEYNLTGEYAWTDTHEYSLFLGHTQAPTSSERDYSPTTSHPFESGSFIVAHNGVLENHQDLAREYFNTQVTVDSEIIPMLLDDLYVGNDVFAITEVCNKLKGIFACWIYSKHTKQVYLVSNGCTLFTDESMQSFSSVKTRKLTQSLKPGIIYTFTSEGLVSSGGFDGSSAFFL